MAEANVGNVVVDAGVAAGSFDWAAQGLDADTSAYVATKGFKTPVDVITSYRNYEKGFFGFLKKYGGEFLTYDDKPITLEGDSPRQGRMIIFKFPSEQTAKDWYADSDYQALSEHRRAGTRLEFANVHAG